MPPAPPRELAFSVEALGRGSCAPRLDDLTRLAQDATPTGARAAYLLGHCLLQTRRFPEAKDAFLSAAERHPTLAGYARLHAASVLMRQGNAGGAADMLAQADQASAVLARRLSLARGEALLRAGDSREALEVLRSLLAAQEPEDEIQARIWLTLGQAAEAQGDRALALRAYGLAWWGIPDTPYALTAEALSRRLAGKTNPLPPPEARVERALRLIKMWDRGGAEEELVLAVRGQLPEDAAANAWYQLGLLRIGKRSAVEAFLQASRYRANQDRSLYWLGQAYYSVNRSSQGRAAWDRMMRLYPGSPWGSRALLSQGRASESRQRWSRADEWYQQAAKFAPESPGADEARWRRGWIKFRQGRYADAERIFRQAADGYPAGMRSAAHLYWAARSREAQGAKAEDVFRLLAERYPVGFYGQQARVKLGIPAPTLAGRPEPEPLPADSFAGTFEELAGLGFIREAAYEAGGLLEKDPSPETLRSVAELQARSGDIVASVAIAEQLVAPALYGPARVDREVWELAYPRVFWPQVVEMSHRSGVDPHLSLAIMREESRFDPRAVSFANAVGLMQLLPSTARGVLGARDLTESGLLDPALNIRSGTAYLGSLLRSYGGNVPLAVAAYNAGPGGVRRSRSVSRTDVPRFVETLRYTETRTYTQRVLQSYAIYQWLYGSER
jgi:soluble lytic murein transglycosylase